MDFKLYLTAAECTTIIAALAAYGEMELASTINVRSVDTAEDGPEVDILKSMPGKLWFWPKAA